MPRKTSQAYTDGQELGTEIACTVLQTVTAKDRQTYLAAVYNRLDATVMNPPFNVARVIDRLTPAGMQAFLSGTVSAAEHVWRAQRGAQSRPVRRNGGAQPRRTEGAGGVPA